MKICVIVFSLSGGGAERATAILSRVLVNLGYDVTILCVVDDVNYMYSGKLINLDQLAQPKKGFAKRIFKFRHTKELFRKEKFDFIIDTRARQSGLKQLMIKWFLFPKSPIIYMAHSYNLQFYFPKSKRFTKFIYGDGFEIVCVSREIANHFRNTYKLDKGVCIYNAFDEIHMQKLAAERTELPEYDYILSYGRIVDEIKDYTFLIESYSNSLLPSKNINLVILGDGPDLVKIKNLVKKLALENKVIFLPFTGNPFPLVKNSLFTTLTSNFEGFPMVLVESLALGVPVVAIDCKSGPSEVINTGKNGILVPWKSKEKFIAAMNKMVVDKEYYDDCKKGTVSSILSFRMENIGKKWKRLLQPGTGSQGPR